MSEVSTPTTFPTRWILGQLWIYLVTLLMSTVLFLPHNSKFYSFFVFSLMDER